MSPSKEVVLILVGALIQSSRFAMSAQNPSGSATERSYMARYLALSQCVFLAHCRSTGYMSDIAPSVTHVPAKAPDDLRRTRSLFTCCKRRPHRPADLLPQDQAA